MADVSVIFASEDTDIVEKLVSYLRKHWDVWWGNDINQGDWDQAVRREISKSKAVVPVFSSHCENKTIFKGELDYAIDKSKKIFPFFIESTDPPLKARGLNRTNAYGWKGEENHPGYLELIKKISSEIGHVNKRLSSIELNGKSLSLPCFMFSLSSHETQIYPINGIAIFQLLKPQTVLLSAYDAWVYYKDASKRLKNWENGRFFKNINNIRNSCSVFILDSGNYEAYRKNDRYSSVSNKHGWRVNHFRQMVNELSPDMAFSFDTVNTKGSIEKIIQKVISQFRADKKAVTSSNTILCPIIHLPPKCKNPGEWASSIITKVALELDPIMVAIPERELGDGIIQRFKTVRDIRKALSGLDKYYPLHLLGAGNPYSILAFAAAGADSFDGLEWCRTVVDYENSNLYHFQHFDFFQEVNLGRIKSKEARTIIETSDMPYSLKVMCYNFDFYADYIAFVRDMIRKGSIEQFVIRGVPKIGQKLIEELKKWVT